MAVTAVGTVDAPVLGDAPHSTRSLLAAVLSALALVRLARDGAADATRARAARVRRSEQPPFSNERREGFENRIAELVAREMRAELRYVWWAQRRGYIRNTLRAGLCDVFIGMPTGLDMVLVTRPYYRSTYVFVTKRDGPRVASFDDPRLKRLRVGVQIIGDDYANAPPAEALSHRGIVRNVRGYSVIGDYRDASPPSRIVRAVEKGEVDVAVVWGPLAGYFARRSTVPLRVVPVSPEVDVPYLPSCSTSHGRAAWRDGAARLARRGDRAPAARHRPHPRRLRRAARRHAGDGRLRPAR
jgi:mxaJ protein